MPGLTARHLTFGAALLDPHNVSDKADEPDEHADPHDWRIRRKELRTGPSCICRAQSEDRDRESEQFYRDADSNSPRRHRPGWLHLSTPVIVMAFGIFQTFRSRSTVGDCAPVIVSVADPGVRKAGKRAV